MSHKYRSSREPFRFSLGGLTAIAGFVAPPLIADDRIRSKVGQPREGQPGAAIETASAPACDPQQPDRRRAA